MIIYKIQAAVYTVNTILNGCLTSTFVHKVRYTVQVTPKCTAAISKIKHHSDPPTSRYIGIIASN